MKKVPEILTLEDSTSPRRSRSLSGNFYSPKVNPKHYKDYNDHDVRIEESACDESINASQMRSKGYTVNRYNEDGGNAYRRDTNTNKYSNFEDTPYQQLENKYNKLREKYDSVKKHAAHWRGSYFNLLKDSLVFDESIKTLYEENRIHLEYIISLESKISKLLVSCNNITNNFHQNLCKSLNMNEINIQTSSSNASMNNVYIKNFNEVLNDYKKQLEILAEEKDSLNTNLSISRHQQLQYSLRMEELQDRLYRIEQARHEDLRALQVS
jgi:hypothetical protein